MKNKMLSNCLLILFLFVVACNDKSTEPQDDITAKPVVKKTSVNYDKESFRLSFPDTASLNNISKYYSNNFTEDKRNKIIEYIKGEVTKLGEDANLFDNILSITGCKLSGEYLLPTYAERAKYESKEAWIFQLTYGLGEPNFAHYKCFAFDIETLDTLAYEGCK